MGVNVGSSYNRYPIPKTTWPGPALGMRPSTGGWGVGAYDPSGVNHPSSLKTAVK